MRDTSTICMGDSYERMSPLWYNTHLSQSHNSIQLIPNHSLTFSNQLIQKTKTKNKNKFNSIMCQIQCACGGSFSGTKFDLIGAGRGQYHAAPSQIQRHFNTKKHKKWIQENQQLCCEGEVYIGEGVYIEEEEEEKEKEQARCVVCSVEIASYYCRDGPTLCMCQSCGEDEEEEDMEELEVRHSRELEEWKADATEEELEELEQCPDDFWKRLITEFPEDEEQKEAEGQRVGVVVELEVDEIEIDGITYYYEEQTDTFYDPETQDKVVPNTIMKEWRDWTYKEIISL